MNLYLTVDEPNDRATHVRVSVGSLTHGGSILSVGPWYRAFGPDGTTSPKAIRIVRRSVFAHNVNPEALQATVKEAITNRYMNSRVWGMIQWACLLAGVSISATGDVDYEEDEA